MASRARPGRVFLVGAGPGDPDLITVRGLRCLRAADVVVFDRLASAELVDLVRPAARRIAVGKTPGHHPWPQHRINALLVAEARRGRTVVRLKGGDPFVFGRGGEECRALAEAGIPFEIVPGITSAVAAPAYAGIPVSDRLHSSAFAVVTGHGSTGGPRPDWAALARIETLVVLMGVGQIRTIAKRLIALGRDGKTPVAVICRATTHDQTVTRSTLAEIADCLPADATPGTIVIGRTAALADRLAWFDPQPGRETEDVDVA